MPTVSREYLNKFIREKHEIDYNCEICGGHYKKYFKNVHNRGKKHLLAVQKIEDAKLLNEAKDVVKLTRENNSLKKKLQEANEQLRIFLKAQQ